LRYLRAGFEPLFVRGCFKMFSLLKHCAAMNLGRCSNPRHGSKPARKNLSA
jgi:hypothetical protein